MQALEGRPPQAISRSSPSSDRNLLARSRRKDGALVTTITVGQRLPLIGWSPSVAGLGRVEARRMLRHPAYWFGLAWLAFLSTNLTLDVIHGREEIWNAVYGGTMLGICLLYAPLTVISANRVAAATFRRRV